jgi:hypothetical protein
MKTIALFGATGSSGKEFLPLALEKGYKVNALVRTPSKVTVEHENLTLIKGAFDSEESVIKEVVDGADYVVFVAGGPLGQPSTYPTDLVTNFIKKLFPILKSIPTIKSFVFQAGFLALSPDEDSRGYMYSFVRNVMARVIRPNIQDNEGSMKYMASVKNDVSFGIIVTRPPQLKEGEVTKKLTTSTEPNSVTYSITTKELALYTMDVMTDESLYGTYPFVKNAE